MDTTNLQLGYYTDTITFSKHLMVTGADPSHTPDLRKLGGVFQCYVKSAKRGWLFSINMEPAVRSYLQTGMIDSPKKTVDIVDMIDTGDKKDVGSCKICKKGYKLDTAVKEYIRFYVGGLPKKVTGELVDKDYRNKISIAFANGSFMCADCMKKEDRA